MFHSSIASAGLVCFLLIRHPWPPSGGHMLYAIVILGYTRTPVASISIALIVLRTSKNSFFGLRDVYIKQ